jgi:Glycosyl hydrolase family 99/Glycosyltransferase WbsX
MRGAVLSRRRFLAQCLAALPAAQAGLAAAQIDRRRAPRERDDVKHRPPLTLAQIGEQLRDRYPDLPSHFIFEYYPWYGANPWRHWDADGRKPPAEIASSYMPALGPYDSRDARVLEQHAKWIAAAGVGAINLSWWGRGTYEDRAAPIVMDVMRAFGIKVTFHIEPYPNRSQTIVEDIKYLLREYGERRRWDTFLLVQHADGSAAPVMKLFESIVPETVTDCRGIVHPVASYVPDEVWRQRTRTLKQELAGEFPKFMLLADSLNIARAVVTGFDGGVSGDPYFRVENWDEVVQNFNAHDLPFVFAANAGFDGVAPKVIPNDPCYRPGRVEPSPDVDWNSEPSRQQEHEASAHRIRETFEKTVRLQVASTSANLRRGFFLVYVNSFNEWHEGTQFEPTVSYGSLSAAERTRYHNAAAGAYRLQTLQSLMAQII